jgi:hypothetical protein
VDAAALVWQTRVVSTGDVNAGYWNSWFDKARRQASRLMHASYFANIVHLSRLRISIDDRSAWGISLIRFE